MLSHWLLPVLSHLHLHRARQEQLLGRLVGARLVVPLPGGETRVRVALLNLSGGALVGIVVGCVIGVQTVAARILLAGRVVDRRGTVALLRVELLALAADRVRVDRVEAGHVF